MADVFAKRGRQEIRHRRHSSGYVGDDNFGCDSASSGEVYDSGEELALDLEVEASPPQRKGGLVPSASGDVEASFFSDYAAQVRPAAPAAPLVSLPVVLTGDQNVRQFCDAAPLAKPRENGEDMVSSNDGDGFYDAEYASSLQGRRATPSPSPPPAALAKWREDGALRSYSHRSGRADSWLDPLCSPSPPPVDTDDDKGLPRGAPHGLSDSPHRAIDASRSAPHSDTPVSHGGPPSVKLREGTVAPSRKPDTELPVHTAVLTASGRAPPGSTTARSAAASALPRNDARRQVHESTASGAGDAPASPHPSSSSPPRSHVRDVYASVSPDRMSDGVVSPPPRKPTATTARDGVQDVTPTLVLAQVPGLRPLLASAATGTGAVQQRVVRELAPRGVPLLLRCTGHAKTPMRTVVLRDASESCNEGEDSEGEEETVIGGPHTTAYRETGSMSDLITSSSPASPATSTNLKGKVESARFTPERAAKPRRRAARSRSPFVSLVTGGHPGGIEMSEVHHLNNASSVSHTSSSSASLSCAAVSAPPELVDFSVHSEALGRCAQEDSLVFCGYSVESFPISPKLIRGARDKAVSKSQTDGQAQHQPCPSAAPCRADCSAAASHLTAHSHIQSSHKENVSYSGFVDRRRASNETRRGAAQQKERGGVVSHSGEDVRAHPWPSRELVYPNPVVEHLSVSPKVALPRGQQQVFNIHTMIDSVEETAVGSGLSGTAAATGAGFRHGYSSQLNPATAAAPHHAEDVSSDYSSASLSATEVKHDQLQRRQQQRAAVRQLLARQTDPQLSSRSLSQRNSLSDSVKYGGAAPRPHSSATYMARQEELRAQRVAAEAEALRLGLALDVCVAVRPFGRDLLLMFLLLVEESKTSLRRRSDVSRARDCNCDRFVDPAVSGESKVSYDTCAEAVNCVLERHGVSWVRATRELCRRVVRWCHHHVRNPTSTAISSASPSEASSVEYTTFVSCVMEFAAQYPRRTL